MEDATSIKIMLLYAANVLFGFFYASSKTSWSSILLVALLVLFCQGLIVRLILQPFLWNPLWHIPVAKGFKPIIGHSMIMFEKPNGSAHLRIMNETPNDGLILTRGLFHGNRLILTTPATIADVLVHKNYDFEKPAWARDFLRRFLGDGLLMTEGDEHKHHRKLIMPAFHFRNIKELYPVFWSKSMELCHAVSGILQEEPEKVLEIGHYSTQVTLDIIGLAGLGRDINSLHNSDDELIANYEEILEPTTEKGLYFLLHLAFPAWFIAALPWGLNKRVKITTSNLKRICTEFVTEKKANMKYESSEKQNSRDILSIMIRSNDFSDENLVDQLLTFLAAG
ncbi:hypothetical protein NX059_008611 [Plenodomus lindquistii]|nr:hypothetical protein NX059_008611 [Plenodomus lindquistii]